MRPLRLHRLLGPLCVTPFLLVGCALGPPPLPDAPAMATTAGAPAASAPANDAASAWPDSNWWAHYGDATLDALIANSLAGAPGIASAEARFGSARENVRVAGAAVGVRIDADASYQHLRLSDNGLLPPDFLGFTQYRQGDIGVRGQFDFDFWGRRAAAVASAEDAALASAAEAQVARLALASAIAEAYFGWQADSARIALIDQRLAALEERAQIVRLREGAGIERGDDTQQALQEEAATRELRAQLAGSRDLRRVQIAALLGTSADALPPFELRPLPVVQAQWPSSVGLDLIARRPDIAASRWRVEAARRDLDYVRTEYYPDVTINALAGLSSIQLGTLFQGDSGVPAIGVAIHLPLYDGGMRDARHGAAAAQLFSAIAQYNEAVVGAAREVSVSATTLTQADEQRAQRDRLLAAAEQSLDLARSRAQAGMTDARPELAARLALLRERDARIQIDHGALLADIQLQEALGGGYNTEQK